ncbi:acetyl/propionyl/methylcrotonyl-CoA carboxylase subunit alpha [Sphingosinicella sp. LY1275]|uniref:acetyl/propionyl/methylcrotonyl-CoA carboxylase subunit alpha n=1 Tax=Sphingosinicella sp. LY1275 TaxID=3095379 RepID=UPI002ADEC61D|nr:acetyl/propionyl/methylcrotonyl-CoA carboxylase subunit alpha [Sphingosinicella sp. LY1275]MEA1016064.1 acetyl/propionyl/methylcrotonyl-CoA carboxylase subunit alpha [Sphingosinicella sp. LY1275]
MIKSLLIANRGEIACRIIRTARRLGIRTVAVFSDADRHALHVREADEAVHIGPSAARESYLVGEKIIAAAKATGAEAIHPGYGFLSENAAFAQAVIDVDLVWVGPNPASITAMGLKDAAKRLMDAAGVPTTPGYLGDDQSPDRLKAEADAIGYPVLIKAVAGGGGKGMRKVNVAGEFADMLRSCKREAASSFGDDRVLIEKYIERPRHIEVQVFGDTHGNVVHLFERDCSLQRRHQKVIEEAPAPGMNEATRAAVCDAAVKAAQAVDYVGAGTIEFIADASDGLRADRIWFMEMNTRLQVEHPVTEEITGQDLVEWQLRVASGETLPKRQDELSIAGWAMEARLYAEDPAHEFLPSTGRLDHFVLGGRIRIDTGVEEGDRISPYYDPMIAKLIATGATRGEAIDRLVDTLQQVEVWPVKTNAAFLACAADDPDFRAGDVDTAFIPARIDRLVPDPRPGEGIWNLAAEAMLASDFGGASDGSDPWRALQGFRANAAPDLHVALSHGGETRAVALGEEQELEGAATAHGDAMLVFADGQAFAFTLPGAGGAAGGGAASDGALVSPMPGRVIAVDARQGDLVAKGAKLVTLEAMKMEHSLLAPFDGIVAELHAAEGAQVSEGTLLVRIEKKGE